MEDKAKISLAVGMVVVALIGSMMGISQGAKVPTENCGWMDFKNDVNGKTRSWWCCTDTDKRVCGADDGGVVMSVALLPDGGVRP